MKFIVSFLLVSTTSFAAIQSNNSTKDSFSIFYNRAQDSSVVMAERWGALLRAAELAQGEQLFKVAEFAKNKDWYMRNASLVALGKIKNDMVYDQAKKLINDKSLIVRSAAADILEQLNTSDVRKVFSEELNKAYNFNKGTSLWIRPQMMKYLSKKPNQMDKDFFVKHLYDKDLKVAALSTEALEKITQVRFSGQNSDEIVKQWRDYARSQRW